jgi:PIN domain nuclease of toxin-antitoxin system
VVSIWEVAIKRGRHPKDFPVDPRILQRGLLDNVYGDIPINSAHDLALFTLPPIHKDPFDRMLVAQAMIEGVTLLTADPVVAQYPGPVRQI